MSNGATAFWRDPALGKPRELDLPQGRLRAFEAGSGEPIVFVHGLLVNANLWRNVVGRLGSDFRCLTLDMPLGSHELALPGADLSGPGLAGLVADAISALGLERATVVGNDSGGAVAQILASRDPERIERLVLTSCDAYENYPPAAFRYLKIAAHVPQATIPALFAPMRLRAVRRAPIAYGWLTHRPIDPTAEATYILPVLRSAGVRRDMQRAIGHGFRREQTLAASEKFAGFEPPVLIAWSRDDRFFKPEYAQRLHDAFPDARLEWIEGARTFSPEDQPERLAELIADFASEARPEAAPGQPAS